MQTPLCKQVHKQVQTALSYATGGDRYNQRRSCTYHFLARSWSGSRGSWVDAIRARRRRRERRLKRQPRRRSLVECDTRPSSPALVAAAPPPHLCAGMALAGSACVKWSGHSGWAYGRVCLLQFLWLDAFFLTSVSAATLRFDAPASLRLVPPDATEGATHHPTNEDPSVLGIPRKCPPPPPPPPPPPLAKRR